MRILFLPSGDRNWAGARFRAWNIADAWGDADCTRWTGKRPDDLEKYDAIVLQKLYDKYNIGNQIAVLNLAGELRAAGKKVFWDLCDPIWWWNEPEWIMEMLVHCSAVTVSCEGLAQDFRRSFGKLPIVIPDRMPYEATFRRHDDVKEPVLVWFGYSMNRGPSLGGMGIVFSRLIYERVPFRIRIIDDHPEIEPWQQERLWSQKLECVKWDEQTIHRELTKCDIALLPPMPGPWAKMKSDNKVSTAAWAGLPVHTGEDFYSLRYLLQSWQERKQFGEDGRKKAEETREIGQSVEQWKRLISASI